MLNHNNKSRFRTSLSHRLLVFILALSNILWSSHMAHAHVFGKAVISIQICSGTETTMVSLGLDGEPIAQSDPCPTCLIPCLAVTPTNPTHLQPVHQNSDVEAQFWSADIGRAKWDNKPLARGPPIVVALIL